METYDGDLRLAAEKKQILYINLRRQPQSHPHSLLHLLLSADGDKKKKCGSFCFSTQMLDRNRMSS